MTAYDAMLDILSINESLDAIKNRNTGDQPDLLDCTVIDLLARYRTLLAEEMAVTMLEVFRDED